MSTPACDVCCSRGPTILDSASGVRLCDGEHRGCEDIMAVAEVDEQIARAVNCAEATFPADLLRRILLTARAGAR